VKIIFKTPSSEANQNLIPNFYQITLRHSSGLLHPSANIVEISEGHLESNHSIDIQLFSIESVYLEWKQVKKAWGDLTRDMIIQNGELLVQGFINQLVPHLALHCQLLPIIPMYT